MKMEHIVYSKSYDIYHDGKELLLVIHESTGDISYHGNALLIVAELDRRGLWRTER